MAEQGEGHRNEKYITMPSREEMIEKLKQAKLYGETPQTDEFYERFVNSVADSEKVGAGLSLAWALANHDTFKEIPIMQGLMNMSFGRAIDAVVQDKDVAKDAKDMMQRAMDASRTKGKTK